MKITPYVTAERRIKTDDTNGILHRRDYGLRVLADPSAVTKDGNLKNGVMEQLQAAGSKAGAKIGKREIQRRIQCAKAYPTDEQLRHAMSQYGSWFALAKAGFPDMDRLPGAPDADYRTEIEKRHHLAAALLPIEEGQLSLFPDLEPTQDTLADMVKYADEMTAMTRRFAERDTVRWEYLQSLMYAVNGDTTVTWEDAHRAAFPDEDVPA